MKCHNIYLFSFHTLSLKENVWIDILGWLGIRNIMFNNCVLHVAQFNGLVCRSKGMHEILHTLYVVCIG